MKRKDGKLYYSIRETGYNIDRSSQTIRTWIYINQKLLQQGSEGIIPEPTRINNALYFSIEDIEIIKKNMKDFKRGDFKEFRKKTAYQRLKEENALLIRQVKELRGGVE